MRLRPIKSWFEASCCGNYVTQSGSQMESFKSSVRDFFHIFSKDQSFGELCAFVDEVLNRKPFLNQFIGIQNAIKNHHEHFNKYEPVKRRGITWDYVII